jgi:sugar lactone lactonase YvrE
MANHDARFTLAQPPAVADGWSVERCTAPSRLFGANGLRTGPDGRVYIAQVTGSQISALDIGTGMVDTISAKGGDIIAPDDVAFDDAGNLYATEVMDGRVSVRAADGTTRVLRDDLPCANGITVHRGRLFIGECREGGRLLELDPAGGQARILLENVPSPNAMAVGPDGLLYFPVMGANEIWRIDPDGGTPDVVATGLGVPDAVKFDSSGRIVSTQVHSGQVLRIDPRTGEQTVLANLNPGLDNLTFVGDRLFVSNFTGEITEVLDGLQTRTVLPGGLNWPLDLTVGPDGRLYIADGTYFYVLQADGTLQALGMLFSPGYPGFVRGVTATGPGEFMVTTSGGQVARFRPAEGESDFLADGLDQLYGVAVGSRGILAVEQGTGRLLAVDAGRTEVVAGGFDTPVGVAIGPDGNPLVSERGRVTRVDGDKTEPLVDDLGCPQGILVCADRLYIVDADGKSLVEVDLSTGSRHTIATGLPIGAPPGVTPKPLRGMPPFSGPQGPFAGIAAGADGTLYVSADAEGSVLALSRTR